MLINNISFTYLSIVDFFFIILKHLLSIMLIGPLCIIIVITAYFYMYLYFFLKEGRVRVLKNILHF